MGLTARTAASFCVFLTLGLTFAAATFFATAFRAGFATTFLAFADGLALAVGFLVARSLAGLRTAVLAAAALLAFGLAGDLAFTARFAVFAPVCL